MNTVTLLRWAGGKGRQLNDLLPLIPNSRVYCEPFGGGAAVLLNKARSPVEVYNDLDDSLVNLFTVLRDEQLYLRFRRLVALTPYSRSTFESALNHESLADPVLRAAAFYTMVNQSISGKRLARKGDWARAKVDNLSDRWFERQEGLVHVTERLRHVQIECRDALDILQEWDSADTTFYCDPPYVLETRSQRKYYAIEPGDDYHNQLVEVLLGVRGNVVLSGYDHPVYAPLIEAGWITDTYGARATMELVQQGGTKQKRTEIVYRNPQCAQSGIRVPLFNLNYTATSLPL